MRRYLLPALVVGLFSCHGKSTTDSSTDTHADSAETGTSCTNPTTFYADTDGDGFGDPATTQDACQAPTGFVTDATDCDDADGLVHPGATESCDGKDDDCNGETDESGPTWYADADGDGYGDPATGVATCDPAPGSVSDASDCDDSNPLTHPDAPETDCQDPTDYNCDGSVGFADADGDGFAACADCDDSSPTVNADMPETCDGADDDCDGTVDEPDAVDASTWYADVDGDGYGDSAVSTDACTQPPDYVALSGDCDDSDTAYNPGVVESDCTDPNDYNCDGSVGFADADGDGFAACKDCDDADAGANPSVVETCDGKDDDCDGAVDEDDASDAVTWYGDADLDGYGDPGVTHVSCAAPTGYVATGDDCDDASTLYHPSADESDCSDPNDYNCDGSVAYADADADGFAACKECDDGDASVNPSATELCNAKDDDCDGTVDEKDAADASTWYADVDGDGFGDPAVTTVACSAPTGFVADATDCDDGKATTFPGATETCNGADDDCNGTVDDDTASGAPTWYADADKDGFGDASATHVSCAAPSGYVGDATDCDDTVATTFPGASETCNGVDDDCNGTKDDDTAIDAPTWYADADGDTYGDPAVTKVTCYVPTGYVADETDCDDGASDVHPGADEYCDGVDEDCNGTTDDDYSLDASTWYADTDNDAYGDEADYTLACDLPSGYVADATDCDDASGSVYPGAAETCDGIDDDCNGTLDDAYATDAKTWYADADGDKYGAAATSSVACSAPSGYVADKTDCDDTKSAINPAATEVCDAADTDENCNGNADNADSGATGRTTYYADADGDMYGAGSGSSLCDATTAYPVTDKTDCDDGASSVHPGAIEVCDAADVDEDCNGKADNADTAATGRTTYYADADKDGYGAGTGSSLCDATTSYPVTDNTDCDDGKSAINPAATEVCDASNTDEDCDGKADDADTSATGKTTFYADVDGDTYGAGSGASLCDASASYPVTNATDCNDAKAAINPAATEVCDAADTDENCNGVADNADSGATGTKSYYADADSDGYGAGAAYALCDATAAYPVTTSTDCNDAVYAVNPGASEVCDASNVDENCNGTADDADSTVSAATKSTFYVDADSDGYGTSTSTVSQCDKPTGYVSTSSDCNDASAYVYPGAVELCDGQYNDCSTAPSWTSASEAGKASLYSSAGAWSDVTSSLAGTTSSIKSYSVPTGNSLYLCDGTWYAKLTMSGTSAVVGRNGSGVTTLAASDVSSTPTSTSVGSVVTISAGTTAGIKGVKITKGYATNGGGIYATTGTIGLEDVVVTGNYSSSNGAGMYVSGAGTALVIKTSTFSSNQVYSSSSYGGGLYMLGTSTSAGTLSVSDSTFSDNVVSIASPTSISSYGYGAGGYLSYVTATLTNDTFSTNKAYYGGGLYLTTGTTATITGSSFTSNTGYYSAGGMYLSGAQLSLSNSTFTGNTAYSNGGAAIYNSSSGKTQTVTNTTFTSNTTGGSVTFGTTTTAYNSARGGAVYHFFGTMTFSNCTFTTNTAKGTTGDGGAIYAYDATTVSGSKFTSNNAEHYGGAIYIPSSYTTDASSSTYSGNYATGYGGTFYVVGTLLLDKAGTTSSTITGPSSTAASNGGGIYSTGTVTAYNTTISGATATSGGGLYAAGGTTTLYGVTISGNTATTAGGGIYQSGASTKVTAQSSSKITGNKSVSGGGWYMDGGGSTSTAAATLDASSITANTATATSGNTFGGGIWLGNYAKFTCQNSGSVTSNTATAASGYTGKGGGAYMTTSGTSLVGGTSTSACDWGTATSDNVSEDIYINTATPTTYTTYGSGAYFTCSGTAGTCL